MPSLAIPYTDDVSEDEIIESLVRAARASDPDGDVPSSCPLYEDPDFSADDLASLYVDTSKLPEYASTTTTGGGAVAWHRPTEYTADPDYFKSTTGCGVLREGALSDAWLLGVLAAVAVHPANLIENLFVSDSLDHFKTYGIFTCRFYKNNRWVRVTTDTRVPYSQSLRRRVAGDGEGDDDEDADDDGRDSPATAPGHVLYGGSLDKNEVFVPFLEKAYAKLHGSYQALVEGQGSVSARILEAMLDCTGGSAHRIDLQDNRRRPTTGAALGDGGDGESEGDDSESARRDALWRRLVRYKKRDCIVTAQLRQLSFNAFDLTATGILKNRQYVLMHVKEVSVAGHAHASGGGGNTQALSRVLRFVKFKNVWGRGMWKGEWSNDDSKWEEHTQVEHALRNDAACSFSRSGADGCFWMVWEDVLETFTELYVAHVFGDGVGDDAFQYGVMGDWVGVAAAGAPKLRLSSSASISAGERPTERSVERTKWRVLPDAEPNWHRNPQFRLTVRERTSGVLLSLAQRDFRLYGGDNYAVNLVLLRQRAVRTSTVWEVVTSKIAAEAHAYDRHGHETTASASASSTTSASGKPTPVRELVHEDVILEPGFAYFLVPYTDHAKVEMEFFLRVFAPKPVTLELVPPVNTRLARGKWRNEDTEAGECMSAGGPLCVQLTSGAENSAWCQNPQFWLRLPRMANAARQAELLGERASATLKIILRRTSSLKSAGGASSSGGASGGNLGGGGGSGSLTAMTASKSRQREHSKDKYHLMGVTVVRAQSVAASRLEDMTATESGGMGGGDQRGGGGAATRAGVLRAQAKAPKTNFLGEVIEKPHAKKSVPSPPHGASLGSPLRRGDKDSAKERERKKKESETRIAVNEEEEDSDAAQAKKSNARGDEEEDEEDSLAAKPMATSSFLADLEAEELTPLKRFPAPRLVVNPDEWCRISDYSSTTVACMHLRKVPKEWLLEDAGGLLIVPTLGEPHTEGSFELQVDSDLPLALDELPRFATQSLPGEWTSSSAMGCHLHGEWKKNPRVFLWLKGVRPAKVKITLTRSELEWKSKCKRNAVGTMMGFYLFAGPRFVRASDVNNGAGMGPQIIINGRPWSETDFVPLHSVTSPPELVLPSACTDPYVIMPATYEPGQLGRFVVSVQCDTEFTLTSEES